MSEEELQKKCAQLESMNDQLLNEISTINELLKSIGFPEGLNSIKIVARDILSENEGEAPPQSF